MSSRFLLSTAALALGVGLLLSPQAAMADDGDGNWRQRMSDRFQNSRGNRQGANWRRDQWRQMMSNGNFSGNWRNGGNWRERLANMSEDDRKQFRRMMRRNIQRRGFNNNFAGQFGGSPGVCGNGGWQGGGWQGGAPFMGNGNVPPGLGMAFGNGNLPPGIARNFGNGNLPPGIAKKLMNGGNFNGGGFGLPGFLGL